MKESNKIPVPKILKYLLRGDFEDGGALTGIVIRSGCRVRGIITLRIAPVGARQISNHDPLDLIQAYLISSAVIELCGAGRGMVRHRGSLFKRAAILEIGRDPGCPETVIA